MAYKGVITQIQTNGLNLQWVTDYYETSSGTNPIDQVTLNDSPSSFSQITPQALEAIMIAGSLAYAGTKSYSMTANDFFMLDGNIMTDAILASLQAATQAPSFTAATRSLNTAFQISTTRNTLASYSVDIATSVSLSGGAVGTVYLEYADNSSFTTNVVEVGRFVNGNTGTLVIGLTLNQTNTAPVSGMIPAGKYVRIRTANTTGTPTFTYRSGQEVLL